MVAGQKELSACGPSEGAASATATASLAEAKRRRGAACRILSLIVLIAMSLGAQPAPSPPARIICFIPAVTEMLFAIGAGPLVVGVGTFDHFPPEVEKLPRVGALLDPDLEKMLSLRPDLVVTYGSQKDLQQQLERARVPMFVYSHAGLPDVTRTIRLLGNRVGRSQEAERAAAGVEAQLDAVRQRVAGRPKPRVLLVFGRESGVLRGIYASGGAGFLHDLLEVAGGSNVLAEDRRQSVQVGTELILARSPDVILELHSAGLDRQRAEALQADWNAIRAVPAVRNGRVHVITDDRTMIPGPRVAEAARLLAAAIHPEAFR